MHIKVDKSTKFNAMSYSFIHMNFTQKKKKEPIWLDYTAQNHETERTQQVKTS